MGKKKGSNAERELIHLFWSKEWAAARIAGSGSTTHPAPDVIAHKEGLCLVIECKACASSSKYLEKREISELLSYAQLAGARPFIAIRFDRKPWFFLNPEDLKETPKFFLVTLNLAESRGLTFEELTKSL